MPRCGDVSRFPPTLLVARLRDFLLSLTSIFTRALHTEGVDERPAMVDSMPHAISAYLAIPENDQANEIVA